MPNVRAISVAPRPCALNSVTRAGSMAKFSWKMERMRSRISVSVTCGQRIEVRATLIEYENRLKIGYEIADCASGQRLTKGHTIQVAVCAATSELQFLSPAVVLEKVERAWAD